MNMAFNLIEKITIPFNHLFFVNFLLKYPSRKRWKRGYGSKHLRGIQTRPGFDGFGLLSR